jgi:RND family efflux transporter MFP subunit
VAAQAKATVSFISPALDPGSTTVEVWLKLPNADGHLKVGTPVHVVILGRTINNALQVPAGAILPGQESETAVMVIGRDGEAHKRAVKTGIRTEDAVQILSGLSTSDNVISEGGYGLDEGTKVQAGKPDAEDGADPGDKASDGSKDKN